MQQFQSSVQAAAAVVASLGREAESAVAVFGTISGWYYYLWEVLAIVFSCAILVSWLLGIPVTQSFYVCLIGTEQRCPCPLSSLTSLAGTFLFLPYAKDALRLLPPMTSNLQGLFHPAVFVVLGAVIIAIGLFIWKGRKACC